MTPYSALEWYWLVGNKSAPDNIFSSSAGAYVAASDAGYESFLAAGNVATKIATDGELADVLTKAGVAASVIQAAGWTDWGDVPIADQLAVLHSAGISLTSTATPALDAVYAVDEVSQRNLIALYSSVKGGDGLPGGGGTFFYRDIDGNPHAFAAADITALAKAVRDYVYALGLAAAAETPVWPAASAAIP